MIAKVCRVLPLAVVAVALLTGSNPLLFPYELLLGIYLRLSRYTEVIARRINTSIVLKGLSLEYKNFSPKRTGFYYGIVSCKRPSLLIKL